MPVLEVTQEENFTGAEHNLGNIFLGTGMYMLTHRTADSLVAQKITIINSACRDLYYPSVVYSRLATHLYPHLCTHFLIEAEKKGEGERGGERERETTEWQTAMYLHIPPWRRRTMDRTTDRFMEIWLQKPGSLWPGHACLLFFPNKRIRRINAHKYL